MEATRRGRLRMSFVMQESRRSTCIQVSPRWGGPRGAQGLQVGPSLHWHYVCGAPLQSLRDDMRCRLAATASQKEREHDFGCSM